MNRSMMRAERLSNIVKLRKSGMTWQHIADQLCITQASVYEFVKRHMPKLLDVKLPNHRLNERKQLIVKLRTAGLSYQEIADELGISRQRVNNFVQLHLPDLVNEKILPRKKLDRLQTIVELRSEGLAWRGIAEKLGTNTSTLFAFVKRNLPQLLEEKVLNDTQSYRLQTIITSRQQGLSWQQIGNKLGTSRTYAYLFAKRHLPDLIKK